MARKKKEELVEPKVDEVNAVKEEYHILKHGETLQDIVKKYGLTVADLQALNGNATIEPTNQIRVR